MASRGCFCMCVHKSKEDMLTNQARVRSAKAVEPGSFEVENHFYPQVINAHIHPMVRFFFSLGNERIARRYCHLNPEADYEGVLELLSVSTTHMRWGGADLFYTTDERGARHMVIIETFERWRQPRAPPTMTPPIRELAP